MNSSDYIEAQRVTLPDCMMPDGAEPCIAFQRLKAERDNFLGALGMTIKTAELLLQNSIGCAVNHYGADFQLHGMPGWLADAERQIKDARARLGPASRQPEPLQNTAAEESQE